MPRYLIERTFPDGFAISTDNRGAQICQLIIENNALDGVTWLHSYVSMDRKKLFCICDAPSSDAIRNAASRNNLPVDQIVQVNR